MLWGAAKAYGDVFNWISETPAGIVERGALRVKSDGESDVWYDINGRRLSGKPAQRGLYIIGDKKVLVQ